MMEHLGFEVRRLSHMKRAVRPHVKMKLKQHWQQPPDLAIFGCSRVSERRIYDEEDECRDRDGERQERSRELLRSRNLLEIIIGGRVGSGF